MNFSVLWWAGQLFGAAAVFFSFGALLYKSDKIHMKGTYIGAALDSIHWFLLFAYTGGVIAILIAIRVYVSSKINNKSNDIKNKWTLFWIITFIVITGITWENVFSLLPLLSTIIATISYIYFSEIPLRVMLIICNIPWAIYSVHVDSIIGIVNAFVASLFLLIAAINIRKERKLV